MARGSCGRPTHANRGRLTEAERMRRHNEEMKLALAENITVLEARRRLAARRWREFEEAIGRRQRCGTAAVENPPAPLPAADIVPPTPQEPKYWWQREDL